jgi:hypothetical protein
MSIQANFPAIAPSLLLEELWKPVVGYEGQYEISKLGNLRSVDRMIAHKSNSTMLRRGRPMRLNANKYGYVDVKLGKNGLQKAYLVHRLVALAFLENQENKPQVNHKNGIKSDNRLDNLEWSSISENRIHAYRVLGSDCWLRHVKGNIWYVTNGCQTKRIVGHYVTPNGWNYGRHNGGRIANRSAI